MGKHTNKTFKAVYDHCKGKLTQELTKTEVNAYKSIINAITVFSVDGAKYNFAQKYQDTIDLIATLVEDGDPNGKPVIDRLNIKKDIYQEIAAKFNVSLEVEL